MLKAVGSAAVFSMVLAGCAQMREASEAKYIIFFRYDSSAIVPAAQSTLDAAISRINSSHPSLIEIGADADQPAAPKFNPQLAEPRIGAVETALISAGISPTLIRRVELPDTNASLGPTADRRVEIRLVMSPAGSKHMPAED